MHRDLSSLEERDSKQPSEGGWLPSRPLRNLLLLSSAIIILASLLLPLDGVAGRLDYLGRAVCGQLPEHSLFCGERQLPLCARCTGTYLGTLLTYVMLGLMGRRKAAGLPSLHILLLLLLFIALWALDGLNSYVTLLRESPLLYEPSNLMRLVTGVLQGTALMLILSPLAALTIWADSRDERVVWGYGDLVLLLMPSAAAALLAQSQKAWLYYPLALSSVAGELLTLGLVNALIICVLLRRERVVKTWRQAMPLWLSGLTLALIELALINLGRSALGRLLGVPL